MRQRVGFARALSLDPEIILMDEPFSSVGRQTRELLQSNCSSFGENPKDRSFRHP
jgi:NitT/TauT family transport system ATP-binding protein